MILCFGVWQEDNSTQNAMFYRCGLWNRRNDEKIQVRESLQADDLPLRKLIEAYMKPFWVRVLNEEDVEE